MILCKYCPEIRQSINEILEHHWTYHEMQKLPFFQCEMCDFYSTRRMQAVNHVKNEHNMDEYRPYKCKHCSTKWRETKEFHIHLESHYKQTVVCNICGKELAANGLSDHISRVHEKDVNAEKNCVCDICGFRTDIKSNLRKHTNQVHKKKKCPYCDYVRGSKNYMEVHIDRKHQEEDGRDLNHICSQCGKGFIFKFSLTDHLR